MNQQQITVAQYGIGPIGAEIARLLLTKPWIKLVAAVDIDPKKAGKDIGEIIGLNKTVGVKVTPELQVKADVVCHSTGSRLREVDGQLKSLLDKFDFPEGSKYRLAGVGVSNFLDEEEETSAQEPTLFKDEG